MKSLSIVLACLSVVCITGCGGGPDNNVVIEMEYDAAKTIKEAMEGVKTSGRIGSNFGEVMSSLRNLKTKDESKGEKVEKLLNELTAAKDPAKVKAKADEIIKAL